MNQEKDRAGSLSQAEWFRIFDLGRNKDSNSVKTALPGRNRTTRLRAYGVACELLGIGNAMLNEAKRKQIAEGVGYSATEKFVSTADSYYRMWLRIKTEKQPPTSETDLDQHCNRLLNTLDMLLPSLISVRDNATDKDETLAVAGLTIGQMEGTEYIDDKGERLLLEHLKSEIPELQKFDSWYEMTPRDLTNDLLDKLTVIDLRGTLKGKCEGCPEIRRTITLVLAK